MFSEEMKGSADSKVFLKQHEGGKDLSHFFSIKGQDSRSDCWIVCSLGSSSVPMLSSSCVCQNISPCKQMNWRLLQPCTVVLGGEVSPLV